MKNTQNAESFAWIIVWVFILSFVILGIANVLTYSISLTWQYEEANDILILKQNLINAVKKTNTDMLQENEIFYVHKNRASSEFEIIIPKNCIDSLPVWGDESICNYYRYIDTLWNTIEDISSFNWDIYSQFLWLSNEDTSFWEVNQIIKASITKLRRREL